MLEPFDLILRIDSSPLASQGYLYAVDAALAAHECELKVAAVLGEGCLMTLCALPSDHIVLKRLRQLELMQIPLLCPTSKGDTSAKIAQQDSKAEGCPEDETNPGSCQSSADKIALFCPKLKLKARFLKEEELFALCCNVKELSF